MSDKTKAELSETVNLIDWHNEHGIENMTLDQQYRLDELLEKWIHLQRYVNQKSWSHEHRHRQHDILKTKINP